MKKILNEYAYSSLAGVVLGLVLLIWPSLSGKLLCYGLALAFLAYGIYRIVCYFIRDAVLTMLRRDLAVGLIAIAVGVFIFARPELLVSLLPVLFGLLLVVGAMSEVQTAFDMKRMEDGRWYFSLIAAAVLAGLGLVSLANPFSTALVLMRFTGAALAVEGICEFVFSILLTKRQRLYYPPEDGGDFFKQNF